jgi:hypothetical protein
MPDSEPKTDVPPQRLCCEIQLFDLCDQDSCGHKNGRFCTDPHLLGRFEKIAENELRSPESYLSEEIVDDEADDGDGYDDDEEFAMENLESGEDAGWEDEE